MNLLDGCPDSSVPPLSHHAQVRLRQRGYRQRDVELVLSHGIDCDEATVLTDEAAARAIATKKREIAALERLRGTAVITAGSTIPTVYRPDRARMRRFLRQANCPRRGRAA